MNSNEFYVQTKYKCDTRIFLVRLLFKWGGGGSLVVASVSSKKGISCVDNMQLPFNDNWDIIGVCRTILVCVGLFSRTVIG